MPPTSPLSKDNILHYFTLLEHSDFLIQRSGSPFRPQPRTQNENWRASGNWLHGSDPASPPLSIPKFPRKISLFHVSLFPPAVIPQRSLQVFERSLSLGRFLYALPPLFSALISNNHNHQYLRPSRPAQPKL